MGGGASSEGQAIDRGDWFKTIKQECMKRKKRMKALKLMLQYTYRGESKLVDIDEGPWEDENTPINEKGRGLTALMICCRAGNYELAEMLIGEGADMTRCTKHIGETPLLMACQGMGAPDGEYWKNQQHNKVVELLLLHDVDPNRPDNSGWFPLRWAVFHGNLEIFNTLMEREPVITNLQKIELQEMARDKQHYDVLDMLQQTFAMESQQMLEDYQNEKVRQREEKIKKALAAKAKKKEQSKTVDKENHNRDMKKVQQQKLALKQKSAIRARKSASEQDPCSLFQCAWAKNEIRLSQGRPLEEVDVLKSSNTQNAGDIAGIYKRTKMMEWKADGNVHSLGKQMQAKKLGKLKDNRMALEQARLYTEARNFLKVYKGHETFEADRSVHDQKWRQAFGTATSERPRKVVLPFDLR